MEPCWFFTKSEDGCKNGQHCPRHHRMLKPAKKRCYICGSTKRMAGECDKPKKDDPPWKGTSKGDTGKTNKGKPKGGKS